MLKPPSVSTRNTLINHEHQLLNLKTTSLSSLLLLLSLLEKKGQIEPHADPLRLTERFCTCVCFCSSSFCGSRDGCLRRRRRQPSEASGPAASSPRPLCPPGSARSLDSGGLARRRSLCRCPPRLMPQHRLSVRR